MDLGEVESILQRDAAAYSPLQHPICRWPELWTKNSTVTTTYRLLLAGPECVGAKFLATGSLIYLRSCKGWTRVRWRVFYSAMPQPTPCCNTQSASGQSSGQRRVQ